MSTKYFCDVCGQERTKGELEEVVRKTPGGTELVFDVCKECAAKVFKGVKEYHATTFYKVEEVKHKEL